ncbi:MAG: 1,4-alpha-glucan branching enzyme [Acidimicrobiaceae bacterium]|jgi:1,4-alpha-glucan branching enzyme
MTRRLLAAEVDAIVKGEHRNPHDFLGHHGGIVRVWRPGASSVVVAGVKAERVHESGLFEARVAETVTEYEVEVHYPDGTVITIDDPYRHWPTLGEVDIYLIGEGRHERLWEVLGAHYRVHEGTAGTAFAVWAPSARAIRVVGDFNLWDGRVHPTRSMGTSGVWELFIPGVEPGERYKFEVIGADGRLRLKADPMAQLAEIPPGTSSIVTVSHHQWTDDEWLSQRGTIDTINQRISTYELHLGSWRHKPEDGDRPLTYLELAEQLPEYVADLGFTHVEMMPVAEHPFGGSWGYQVSSYYAPTSRFGSPDDFRVLVEALHARGIGVIVDWVPAHFPKDEWALARFDGTALYEHADPRQGEHPDWGTLVFNFGRHEVRNFLLANALYWVEEFHIDGLRVDAVASMLYLDYSRKEGEWVPNEFGGRENLEAIHFLQEVNTVLYGRCPGVLTIAEESTAFPGVSRPVHLGGLGFAHKWNMGWMHDTLAYFSLDPIHRRYHHHDLTFGMMYAWSENFVLPLSHDEVVHLKGSLLQKMPGDRWQKFANLRALYGWMWAHPGKQLVFMGGEFAQEREWSEVRSLDWHLLDDGLHRGVQSLMRSINAVEAAEPALYTADFTPDGFSWIDANDSDQSVYSFMRFDPHGGGRPVACVANLTPVPRHGYRLGLPIAGRWREILNTDASDFGGGGVVNGEVWTDGVAWHGHQQSVALTLPPLGVVWLAPD